MVSTQAEDLISEMDLRGELPTSSKVVIEPNYIDYEDVAEDESIVDIRVTQPKEVVLAE